MNETVDELPDYAVPQWMADLAQQMEAIRENPDLLPPAPADYLVEDDEEEV